MRFNKLLLCLGLEPSVSLRQLAVSLYSDTLMHDIRVAASKVVDHGRA